MSDHSSSNHHSNSSDKHRSRHSRKESKRGQTDQSFVSMASGSEMKTAAPTVAVSSAKTTSKSTRAGKRHHRHRHTEIPATVYEGQKEEIARINSLNLTLETDTAKRKALLFTIAIILVGGILFFFQYRSGNYEGSRLKLIGHFALIMFLFWGMVWEAYHFSRKIISLQTLIQFQETRVDSLKAALAHHEKKIQDLTEANKASQAWSGEQEGNRSPLTGLP